MSDLEVAKQKDIVSVLSDYGYSPTKTTGSYYFYYSMLPGRSENNPSFRVKKSGVSWADPGYNGYGDVLDLVMILEQCSLNKAINKLLYGDFDRVDALKKEEDKEPGIIVESVCDLVDDRLIQYMTITRCIDIKIVEENIKQVAVRFPKGHRPDKTIDMCGFKNDLGGYELRTESFKVSTPPKYYTSKKGVKKALNVFEGFMDYLSALTIGLIQGNVIVLNSLSNFYLIKDRLLNQPLNLWLDNDSAANNVIRELQMEGFPYRDMRHAYKEYNDLNEMLCDIKE